MNLHSLLSSKKAAISDRWLDLILESYPADSTGFFKKTKDPFQNPVGQTFAMKTGCILDELLADADPGRLASHLQEIVKIKAVQDFPPSEALNFLFLLKQAIRENLEGALRADEISRADEITKELVTFESSIDRLTLKAFDLYMGCKNRMYEIRADEHRRRAYKLWERAGLNVSNPVEQEEDLS